MLLTRGRGATVAVDVGMIATRISVCFDWGRIRDFFLIGGLQSHDVDVVGATLTQANWTPSGTEPAPQRRLLHRKTILASSCATK